MTCLPEWPAGAVLNGAVLSVLTELRAVLSSDGQLGGGAWV